MVGTPARVNAPSAHCGHAMMLSCPTIQCTTQLHPHLMDGWNVTKFKFRANIVPHIESKPILSSLMFPSPQNVKIHLISVRTKRRKLRSETAANPCQNGQKRRRSWRRRDNFCQLLCFCSEPFKSRHRAVSKAQR